MEPDDFLEMVNGFDEATKAHLKKLLYINEE